MRILLTDARSLLSTRLIEFLNRRQGTAVRVAGREHPDVSSEVEYLTGELSDKRIAAEAVRDVDAVVHLLPLRLADAFEGGKISEPDAMDLVMRGTRNLIVESVRASVPRVIVGSSLALFDRHPPHWDVTEMWRPRPAPATGELLPWVTELSGRELIRLGTIEAICLRFGHVVDEEEIEGKPFDPRWVHVDDAVHAIDRALAVELSQAIDAGKPEWHVFHIMAPGPNSKIRHGLQTGIEERSTSGSPPFNYTPSRRLEHLAGVLPADPPVKDTRPWQEILAPVNPIRTRPIRKVVLFGAGGPMGAFAAQAMMDGYHVRLADIAPLDWESLDPARSAHHPMPSSHIEQPHEFVQVDVQDPEQVRAACEGMDAIVNCSVLRDDEVKSFRINAVGALNMARAAVEFGIRRIVQTSPLLHLVNGHGSHLWDYQIPVEAASRPYASLYFLTKYLGNEILRVFAEHHGLEVAVMLYWEMTNPTLPSVKPPFMVSWPDSGRALRRALEVPELPSPFEEFNVSVDMPHGKFDHSKIRRVLGWEPLDNLDHFWQT